MTKKKRKRTAEQKAKAQRRRERFQTAFIGGRQRRIRRPPTVDRVAEDGFLRANADAAWLHANERWDLISSHGEGDGDSGDDEPALPDDDLPF
jgi:hypothetical protein